MPNHSLTEGTGANVAKLVLEDGWDYLLLDGGFENLSINLHKHFLTSENICKIFSEYKVPKIPEYISIDVDSTDLWLFEAVLKKYRAMLFSVEYNSHFPLNKAITFPNDKNQYWDHNRAYGASLKALNLVAQNNGYSLLWVVSGFDAFFIRNDLIDDYSKEICFPFEKWKNCTNIVGHPPVKDKNNFSKFIDYEVYIRSNKNIIKSQKEAQKVCEDYLMFNPLRDFVISPYKNFKNNIRKL